MNQERIAQSLAVKHLRDSLSKPSPAEVNTNKFWCYKCQVYKPKLGSKKGLVGFKCLDCLNKSTK